MPTTITTPTTFVPRYTRTPIFSGGGGLLGYRIDAPDGSVYCAAEGAILPPSGWCLIYAQEVVFAGGPHGLSRRLRLPREPRLWKEDPYLWVLREAHRDQLASMYLWWWQQTVVADGYHDATHGRRVVVGDLTFRGPEAAAICDEEEIYLSS